MSSLASFVARPGTEAYCASKAAVRVWGEGLRERLRPQGVAVSVVCPGFVDTPLTRRNPFPMPMLMAAEPAARADQGAARPRRRPDRVPVAALLGGPAGRGAAGVGPAAADRALAGQGVSRPQPLSAVAQLAPAGDVAVVLGQGAGERRGRRRRWRRSRDSRPRPGATAAASAARPGLAIGPGGRPAMR